MPSRLRIIVTGLIAEYPLGGMTWHYLQYVLGLAKLGQDVFYLEDSGGWPYNPVEGGLARDCRYNVRYLSEVMSRFGLADRWSYRFKEEKQSQWFGLSDQMRAEVIASADLVLNVSGTIDCPEDYRSAQRLAYIDTDPVFTQLRLLRADEGFVERVSAHDVHFTFGELISQGPLTTGHHWHATRQPVVLSEWHPGSPHRDVYTTIMNWTSYKSELYRGRTYGQKDIEFMRYLELPRRAAPTMLEIAGAPGHTHKTPRHRLAQMGWQIVEPNTVCPDPASYQQYIESSKGEWSVAKNAYVQGRSGWFSERSACYLAAGKPVILQDTGFSAILPVGEGLLAFDNMEQAVSAINEVETNYARHEKAARAIAEEYFDSDKVLGSILTQMGL